MARKRESVAGGGDPGLTAAGYSADPGPPASTRPASPPQFPIAAYKAALEKEREIRDFPFLGIQHEIGGLPCQQLTLRIYMQLSAAQSPFIVGGKIGPEDVAIFLWRLSPDYCIPVPVHKRAAFIKKAATLPYADTRQAIEDYLDQVFFDAPKSQGEASRAPTVSFAAAMIDIFAPEYGWTPNDILDSPLSVLYQLYKEISGRKKIARASFNPLSDRVKKQFLIDLEEFNKAVAK